MLSASLVLAFVPLACRSLSKIYTLFVCGFAVSVDIVCTVASVLSTFGADTIACDDTGEVTPVDAPPVEPPPSNFWFWILATFAKPVATVVASAIRLAG